METGSRISEFLYVGMCFKIGTPTQVKIRRDVTDARNTICQSLYEGARFMDSGSSREGFRLNTSDVDTMFWDPNHIVICNMSQIRSPFNLTQTLILMECHNTPPGFAKLRLLTPTNDPIIRQSCVSVNDQVYISSSLHREVSRRDLLIISPFYQSVTLHGPCTSGIQGSLEYDMAFCFSCQHWPLPANHWIQRSQRQGWPSSQVLQDITSNGCYFVAIGSGGSISPQQCETEWRMSFSHAEYKLVSSMNHAQFLCYGTLKIFLKEVLNVGLEDPLLCSYFIKTALFWKIQENTISVLCPKNILHCVWMCFKYLTQCVYRGEFPNFFIPQNNMFMKKIHGAAQKQLFVYLMSLYDMGFSCLLLSPTLNVILSMTNLFPHAQFSTDERCIISEVQLDIDLYLEIREVISFVHLENDNHVSVVSIIDTLYKTTPPTSPEIHFAVLHVMRNYSLIRHAFCLDKSNEDNNLHTTDNCGPLDILMSAAESGFISDALYVAMYLYNKNRYTEALYFIECTKQNLSQSYVFHRNTDSFNRERYMETVGGNSLKDKIRRAVSFLIAIDHICCIDEVKLEVFVCKQNDCPLLLISPLVMTQMLSFLCHHHLGDRLRSRQSLDDLQNLVHYDEGQHIDPSSRDITWQMLGVCEQINGDKERALYSYKQSLQYPRNNINAASWTRIHNIISK